MAWISSSPSANTVPPDFAESLIPINGHRAFASGRTAIKLPHRSLQSNELTPTWIRATGTMCYATPAVGVGRITAKHCIAFGGSSVDEAISKELLQVAPPAAVEAAVLASQEEARRRDDVLEALSRDLEAARYAAQRAQRQYDGADPENRLAASELEQRWNQALQRVRAVETKITRHLRNLATMPQRSQKNLLFWQVNSRWYGMTRTPMWTAPAEKLFWSFIAKVVCTRN